MRKFCAPLVYTLSGPPVVNGAVLIDDDGFILEVSSGSQKGGFRNGVDSRLPNHFSVTSPDQREEVISFPEGVLVPGFINVHTHLELSHLCGIIPEKNGIGGFIAAIHEQRRAPDEMVISAARKAADEMYHNGISGVGDISNNAITAPIKGETPLEWITFVEVFGFQPSLAGKALRQALAVQEEFTTYGITASVVPHSPYSVSDSLLQAISALPAGKSDRLSIHNQESCEEELFFRSGEGPIRDHMTKNLGLDLSHWQPPRKSSLAATLPKLPLHKPLLLVHNTFTTEEDLELIERIRPSDNTWLVLCPNSNLYIEGILPPVPLLRGSSLPLCLGTDSLASNHQLSIFSELVTLHNNFPEVEAPELFTIACLNGAKALGLSDRLGSLEPGKRPGLLLITPDPGNGRLFSHGSRVIRLA